MTNTTHSIIFNESFYDLWESVCTTLPDLIHEQEQRFLRADALDILDRTYCSIDLYDAMCLVDREPHAEWHAIIDAHADDVNARIRAEWEWLAKQPDRAQLLTLLDLYLDGWADDDGWSIGRMEDFCTA